MLRAFSTHACGPAFLPHCSSSCAPRLGSGPSLSLTPHSPRYHTLPSVSSALQRCVNSSQTPSPPPGLNFLPEAPASSSPTSLALSRNLLRAPTVGPWPMASKWSMRTKAPQRTDPAPHERLTNPSCGLATCQLPHSQGPRASKPPAVNRPPCPASGSAFTWHSLQWHSNTAPAHPHLHPVYSLPRGINLPVRPSPACTRSPL